MIIATKLFILLVQLITPTYIYLLCCFYLPPARIIKPSPFWEKIMAKIKPQRISLLTILVLSFQCCKVLADGKLFHVKCMEEIQKTSPQNSFKSIELFEKIKKYSPLSLHARSLRGAFASHGGSRRRRRRRSNHLQVSSGGSRVAFCESKKYIAINVSMVLFFLFIIS